MKSVSRFLITTADERTWPKDQPVLFLGEWCRLYNRKSVWQQLDAEVVPYHWDDRRKLYRDYLYLNDLYEELLSDLASSLNAIHGVEHSVRYWRILVGPWLGSFVQIVFDRWAMIKQAISEYDIAAVRVLDTQPENVVPNDMEHFIKLFLDDPWNEAIYGELLQNLNSVPIERVPIANNQLSEVNEGGAPRSFVGRLRSYFAGAACCFAKVFKRDDEAFFLSTYLPMKEDLCLQWSLRQVPKLWRALPTPRILVDGSKRQWRMDLSGSEGFSAIVREMIPRHIPTLYLEGYSELQSSCATASWPKRPKLIFTSNAFSSDDVFKAWTAEKVEAGQPLVVGQHGGSYGVALWNFGEDHQCAISDTWLSWGWTKEGNEKIKPVGNLKSISHRVNWDREGQALMVEMAMPRYSYFMYSVPVASQWLDYFDDQSRFVAALPPDLQKQLLVRLYREDCGWCQEQRWQDRFPRVSLDAGALPIESLINQSRLYIATYNSTIFLESLGMNIPTIMFWNPEHWELRADAVPYFNSLKEVGIFHESPESAASKMIDIWDDVPGWWQQPKIQEARQYFCHQYARILDDPIKTLKKVMTAEIGQDS